MLKNVLSDERVIKEANILFLLSSTVEGWKPFIKMNHPIGRFFIPRMELQNFDEKETIFLIDSILKGTGVSFGDSVKNNIFKYTEGHLFQIHSLGSALYDNQKTDKVTEKEWEKGFEEGLFYLGNAVYDGMIEKISDNEIEIIKNLKIFESNKIKDINRKIKVKSINEYLRRLVDKGILKTIKRGEYIISDKMLGEYLQRK